jgi:hypothetical protein
MLPPVRRRFLRKSVSFRYFSRSNLRALTTLRRSQPQGSCARGISFDIYTDSVIAIKVRLDSQLRNGHTPLDWSRRFPSPGNKESCDRSKFLLSCLHLAARIAQEQPNYQSIWFSVCGHTDSFS